MQEVDKAGCETLTKKYTYLTSTLQANICDLLPHFFEKKLISPRQKQKIECVTKEEGQISGCEKLLDALLGNGSEGAFQKFLEIQLSLIWIILCQSCNVSGALTV